MSIRMGESDEHTWRLTSSQWACCAVFKSASLAHSRNPNQRATPGYNLATRGRISFGTTSRPSSNLAAPANALTSGATLSSSFLAPPIWMTNVTISSPVVPLGIPRLAASWEILACQRCGAPRGLNATVSRISRYVQLAGVCFRHHGRQSQQTML